MAAKIGLAGQDGRMGLPGKISQDRTARTFRTAQPGRDHQETTGRTGLLGKKNLDKSVRKVRTSNSRKFDKNLAYWCKVFFHLKQIECKM
jgi:hypothetical protein